MHFNKSPHVVHTKINGNKEKGLGPHIVVVAHSATHNHIIQWKISNEIVSVSQTESPKSIIKSYLAQKRHNCNTLSIFKGSTPFHKMNISTL